VDDFPSLKARRLLAILCREPLGYRVVRQSGSHRTLRAPGRPPVLFAFHGHGRTVRKILCRDVGLEPQQARRLL
jgi:predicted RNA binding protein YcfA (HicA-like mRNA interferase family)